MIFETLATRLGGSAFLAGVKYLYDRLVPHRIKAKKTPRNFFEHIGPGVSKEFVVASLGPPHRQCEEMWQYNFGDALAQIEFYVDGAARSVALAITNDSPKQGFKLPTLEVPLGKLTFNEFLVCPEGHFRYRSTLRTCELLYEVKFPPSWTSNHYTFGALCVLTPGALAESAFNTQLAESNASSAAKDVRVNWIGLSNSSEELWFDWSIALPMSA